MRLAKSLRWFGLWVLSIAATVAWTAGHAQSPSPGQANSVVRYEYRANHDPDGIGVFYCGREIAQVMGHEAADWLERPERDAEEQPDLLLAALKLKSGNVVADIGAGSGYYTRRLAKLVGESGIVYAEEIQPQMLEILTNRMAELKIQNVRPVLGTIMDPKLPRAAVDLILMVDVYHEFDHPFEMAQAMCSALKPGGRMVFVEFRGEDPHVPIKPLHKMTEAQVRKEMAAQPLAWVSTSEVMPRQHIIVFQKKE
jgi:protein-L-isoaspartate O-methyltransferase